MSVKKGLTPTILLFLFSLACIGEASAAKLYKWVDENGVTHFGYAPPPVQKAEDAPKVTTISTGGSSDDSGSGRHGFRGTWYAAEGFATTRRLELKYGDFEITDLTPDHYSFTRRKVASGKAEYRNGMLMLTYYEHLTDPSKLDVTDEFEVVSADDRRLELVDLQGNRQIYKQQSESDNSPFFRDISGEWVDENGTRYRFRRGSFTVYPDDKPRSRRLGNLEWADPELTFDYVSDFLDPVNHATPRIERWILRDRNTQQMTFVIVGPGEVKTLRRRN